MVSRSRRRSDKQHYEFGFSLVLFLTGGSFLVGLLIGDSGILRTPSKPETLPDDVSQLLSLATDVWYSKNIDEARRVDEYRRILVKVKSIEPKNFDANLILGTIYSDYTDPPELELAHQYYTVALEVARTPELLRSMGSLLVALERYDEARLYFLEALEKTPENSLALHGYGRLLFIQKKFLEAGQIYEKILELDPNDEKAQRWARVSRQQAPSESKDPD